MWYLSSTLTSQSPALCMCECLCPLCVRAFESPVTVTVTKHMEMLCKLSYYSRKPRKCCCSCCPLRRCHGSEFFPGVLKPYKKSEGKEKKYGKSGRGRRGGGMMWDRGEGSGCVLYLAPLDRSQCGMSPMGSCVWHLVSSWGTAFQRCGTLGGEGLLKWVTGERPWCLIAPTS